MGTLLGAIRFASTRINDRVNFYSSKGERAFELELRLVPSSAAYQTETSPHFSIVAKLAFLIFSVLRHFSVTLLVKAYLKTEKLIGAVRMRRLQLESCALSRFL